MISEIFNKINKTETCRVLNKEAIQKIDSIKDYKNIIELTTEVSLRKGVKEVVLYVGIPEPPITLPKIFIKNESYEDIKFIPHINKDLSICIYDEGMSHIINVSAFPDLVEEMIHRAKKIIAQVDDLEAMSEEFEREFKAKFDEPIIMKLNSYYEVLVNNSVKGKLYSITNHSPEITLFISTNNDVREFRTSKSLLESGFSSGKFVNSIEDFKGILTNQNTNEIKSFFVRSREMSDFKNEIIIKEYKISQ